VTALTDSDDYQPNEFREPVEPRKCRKHVWGNKTTRYRMQPIGEPENITTCIRCGRLQDLALSRRGKQSRNYGNRAELKAANKYGGTKIGAAGGPVDIRGKDFATQMKTHRRPVPSEWRKVFAAMGQENRCRRLLLRFVQGPGVAPADFFVFQAELLRVSTATLRLWHLHDGFPVMRLGHRTARVDPAQLREWLDSKTCAENGRQGASTSTEIAGASQSALAPTPSESASARNGKSARRRPPSASYGKSRQGSVVAFQPKKAGSQ
jgi:hypothetical protein